MTTRAGRAAPGAGTPASNRRISARALRELIERDRVVGWREWLALPQLGIARIKAKVDTGARTSALHVYDLALVEHDGHPVVSFKPPVDGRPGRTAIEIPVGDVRAVKNSSGQAETRYVISTVFVLGPYSFVSEVTLTSRDDMTYNMLLGRSALRTGRLLVHPSRSFLQSIPQSAG